MVCDKVGNPSTSERESLETTYWRNIMATPSAPANQPARTPPAHEVRLGAIRAVIWANETENGTRYNVTFERSYRDGETWKSSSSFSRDDLLVVAKAADQAHTWILSQRRERPEESGTPESKPRRKPGGSLSGAQFPAASDS